MFGWIAVNYLKGKSPALHLLLSQYILHPIHSRDGSWIRRRACQCCVRRCWLGFEMLNTEACR